MSRLACDVLEGRIRPPGGVIYEDDQWVVDHSVSPVLLKGWLIMKPKRHVEDLGDLTPEEAAGLGPLARSAAAAIQEALDAERVYLCSLGGEPNLHVHFHVIPRHIGMPEGAWRVLAEMWSGDSPWACGDEEAVEVVDKVRSTWR